MDVGGGLRIEEIERAAAEEIGLQGKIVHDWGLHFPLSEILFGR